jgi:hypothetical protein
MTIDNETVKLIITGVIAALAGGGLGEGLDYITAEDVEEFIIETEVIHEDIDARLMVLEAVLLEE